MKNILTKDVGSVCYFVLTVLAVCGMHVFINCIGADTCVAEGVWGIFIAGLAFVSPVLCLIWLYITLKYVLVRIFKKIF